MDFTEKTLSSKEIFKGKIINVRVDRVSLPNGQESTREIVEHRGAVAVVAIDEEENVIMVRQYRKPLETVTLEIPAGTLEEDENPLLCAQRELEEEAKVKAGKWGRILSYYSAAGFCNELLHLYLAEDISDGFAPTDDDEFVEVVRVPLSQAYQYILSGKIIDGKSIIGIQHAYFNRRESSS